MKKYKTALGRTVDMGELVAKNEKTRAVGNMKVNARGDTIDANGKVIEPVTSKVNNRYANTVGNRAAQPVRQAKPRRPGNDTVPVTKAPVRAQAPVQAQKPVVNELTEAEKELEEDFENDIEVEQIKANESKQ